MDVSSHVVYQLYMLAAFVLAACSGAPTTIALTTGMMTTQTVSDLYEMLITEAQALNNQFSSTVTQYMGRFDQSNVMAPNLVIDGFLTMADLPSSPERRAMTEDELLPKHKTFLQTYAVVMERLAWEEKNAFTLNPSAYSSSFEDSYKAILLSINRLLNKVTELMVRQSIADGDDATFTGFTWLPSNPQIHNTRSLYVLQKIQDYLPASINDYILLDAKSQS